MKITQELLTALKRHYANCSEVCDMEDHVEISVSDLSKGDFGKWLVIIDYHD